MENKIFKNDAKQIVDLAFDNKLFKDDLTRDDFNAFEDLIQFLLQSKFESIKKADELFESIDKRRTEKTFTQSPSSLSDYLTPYNNINELFKGIARAINAEDARTFNKKPFTKIKVDLCNGSPAYHGYSFELPTGKP